MAVIDGKWLSKEGLTYFWSKIKSIFTKQTETNVIANAGAKNLFPNAAASQTIGGVTFTVHDDGTVTVNGTKTNNDWFILSENNSFDAGTYTLSDGLPDDTINCRLIISTARSMSATIMSTETNLRTQTRTFTTAKTGLYYAIRIASGATVNNLTFKPMIRRAEITDDTFQPYAPTNRELYETRFASKTILPNNVDLNNIKTGGIYNGVNSTGNSAVHMPVAAGSFNFVLTVIEANEFIIQIFKQLNSAGDPNFYIRRFYIYNSDWDSWYQFTGTQV